MVKEAAKILSVKTRTIRIWLRTNKLKGVKVNRLWRITERNFNNFLQVNLSNLVQNDIRRFH